MQADLLKELGLSPVWVKKSTAQAMQAAATAPRAATAAAAPPSAAAPTAPAAPAAATTPAPVTTPAAAVPVHKMSWQQLRTAVENCKACPLCEKRTQPAFGCGDTQARVMFVGEGPGEEEDRRGEPFVGNAGKLLDLMLHSIGLARSSEVYIANVVKCRPPRNRTPETSEALACLPYLQRQIALVQPHLLVALGKVAASHLLNVETSIAQLRQKMHEYEKTPLVVTYHPAYLLRQPQEKSKAWEDLLFIRKMMGSLNS